MSDIKEVKREIVLKWQTNRGAYEYWLEEREAKTGKLLRTTHLDGLSSASANARHYNLDVPQMPEV